MSNNHEAKAKVQAEVQALLEETGLAPLPREEYPREFEQRTLTKGYYTALVLVLSVWMITPLSCAYLIWYILFSQHPGLTATIFAGYALTESVFAIYYHYLSHWVQPPSPQSSLSLDECHVMFHRVLDAGLTVPGMPTLAHDREEDDNVAASAEQLYKSGLITPAQLWHAQDYKYECEMGMVARHCVGRITNSDASVISSFVERVPGEREERLRNEIEGTVQEEEEEGLVTSKGHVRHLHHYDRRAVEFRERLRTWFDHAPWEDLMREDVLTFLAWMNFNLPLPKAQEDNERRELLEKQLVILEARTGGAFPKGQRKTKVIRLTLDPVNTKGRPLILYALANTINWWIRDVVYPAHGMGLYTEGGIDYLIRIPKGWTPERGRVHPNCIPIVYFHGLGFGLLQNHILIKQILTTLPTHPLVVPLAHHTAQALASERHLIPWTRPELVSTLERICEKWGFWERPIEGKPFRGGVSILSHSNGSVAHAWVLKDSPTLARRSAFVDPVVFCLWEGDVCHSFCYRQPTTALELLLYYFISTEVGIANYIQRHFNWTSNTLFFDDIPFGTDGSKTAFFLGGKDFIIDAGRVRRYLEQYGVTSGLHWDADAGHGDGLAGESCQRVVMFAGTGSTQGWQGWLSKGRYHHEKSQDDELSNPPDLVTNQVQE